MGGGRARSSGRVNFNPLEYGCARRAGLEDIVLGAITGNETSPGFDFWWIDWQQGGDKGGCTGELINPTIWTDKLRATYHIRRGETKRGMVLARWGGLGNHRYQVGFSGDVNPLAWNSFAYQPYFSSTASNVGYGFWSHDIEGPGDDHELYTRWIQWASQPHMVVVSKWLESNIWIRYVLWSQHQRCRGSQPIRVSNPDFVMKKFKPY